MSVQYTIYRQTVIYNHWCQEGSSVAIVRFDLIFAPMQRMARKFVESAIRAIRTSRD